jgi:hypothetical protein
VEKTGIPGENHRPAAFGKFYKSFLVQNIPLGEKKIKD